MATYEELRDQLESVYHQLLQARPPTTRPSTKPKPRTPTFPSLADVDLDAVLPPADLLALVVRGRREVTALTTKCLSLEETVRAMESLGRERDVREAALAAERDSLKGKVDELRATVVGLERELAMAREEGKVQVEQARAGLRKDQPAFDVLVGLENLVKSKSREIEVLQEEAKGLHALLRAKDKTIVKAASSSSMDAGAETVVALRSQVKMLTKQLADIQAENKVLDRLFKVKSKDDGKARRGGAADGGADTTVVDLQNQLKAKDRQIRDLEEEKKLLERLGDRKTKQLVHKIEEIEENPFAGKAWQEERRALVAELAAEKEKRLALEKAVKANNAQFAAMSARLEFMAEVQRKPNSKGPLSPSRPATAPAEPPSTTSNSSAEVVPAELYDALAREFRQVKRLVAQKESLLVEKDAVVETLERKSGILDKARNVESRKGRQEAAQMATAIADLKIRVVEKTEDFKNKELQLRMQNLRLKNQLKAANAYIAEYLGDGAVTFDPVGEIDGDH